MFLQRNSCCWFLTKQCWRDPRQNFVSIFTRMIKKFIYTITGLLFLSGCGEKGHTEIPNGGQTDLHLPAKAKPAPVMFYKGQGNEPGWNIVINSTEEGNFPTTLVTAYGQDTLTGFLGRMPIMKETKDGKGMAQVKSNEMKYSGDLTLRGASIPVIISIVSEPCADDADQKFPTNCEVKVGDTRLIGCGVYFE